MTATVNDQSITITDESLTVSESVGIYECDFTFDASWDDWNKTAVFEGAGETIEMIVVDNKAQIPWEVLKEAGWIKIGVYGTKGGEVKPTIWSDQIYVAAGTVPGSIIVTPTPSIYAQILDLANDAKDIAEDVANDWAAVTAEASTLAAGSPASASFANNKFTFGIPQGPKGDTGATGATGATPNFSIGTVSTLAAGADATASITGTEAAPVLNLGIPQGIKGDNGDVANIASVYSSSATYAVGDYCIYNSQLYRCTTAITTAEAWTAAHWTAVQLGDDTSTLRAALNPLVYLPIDESTFTSGYYVWSDGKPYTNANYKLSPFIRCAFKRIIFNCLTYGGGVQSIAFYSDALTSTFISGYENTASLSTYPAHEMDVPEGTKYIRITKNATNQYTASQTPRVRSTETGEHISERIEAAQNTADEALYKVEHIDASEILAGVYSEVYSDVNLIPSDGLILHSYLNNSGEVKTVTNPSAVDYAKCISGYIPVVPNKILYMSGDNFLYSQFFGFYDENKSYLGGKNEYSGFVFSNHVATKEVPTGAYYLRVTFYTEADASAAWAGYTGAQPTGEVINASNDGYQDYHYFPSNPCDYIGREVSVFNKIACIGDSMTSGYFNHSGGGESITKYAYPAHLQKMTGVTCVNMGDAGETSVSWWTAHSSDDFSGYDCAIINLGINDALYSVLESDTRTAFGNIISALKTANTGIKIFIANINPAYSRGNTTYDAVNAIIEDIATNTTDCYFIDLTEYGHTVGTANVNGHLTAVGYRMLAQDYASAISYIIRNYPYGFRYVQFIGTNLHN